MKDQRSPRPEMVALGMSRFKEFMQSHYQVTGDEWTVMARFGNVVEIQKEELFVREGSVCRALGFIAEGVMRYVRFEESGDVTTCYFASENDFVGDPESFEAQRPSDKNLIAVTDCLLLFISHEGWQGLAKELPRFGKIAAGIQQTTFMSLLR